MQMMFMHKSIIWGHENTGVLNRIVKYKDGIGLESFSDFVGNEKVLKFLELKGILYALLVDNMADTSRLIRLELIVEGGADTWVEVFDETEMPFYFSCAEYYLDGLVFFSHEAPGKGFSWDGVDGSSLIDLGVTWLTEMADVYYSISVGDKIYMLTYYNSKNHIVSWDEENDTVLVASNAAYVAVPTGFDMYGANMMVEWGGKIYWFDASGGVFHLWACDLESGANGIVMGLDMYWPTCIIAEQGVIYMGVADASPATAYNMMMYTPEKFSQESALMSGEGKALSSLKKIVSDPIFLITSAKTGSLSYSKEYPVIGVLGGVLNPVIKYGKRLEFYTDLNDGMDNLDLKTMMDELCSMTNRNFIVDADNIAKVQDRDLVGYSNSYMTVSDGSDYGDAFLQDVAYSGKYEAMFRRILLTWANSRYSSPSPVVVGSNVGDSATLDLNFGLLNNPILALNIGRYLLKRMDITEYLSVVMALSYFLEKGDNMRFAVDSFGLYIDGEREWKVNAVEHSLGERTTTLKLLERSLLEYRASI